MTLLVCAVLLAALLLAVRPNGGARATTGDMPYSVPFVTDTNPDSNIVETTIVAEEATVDIGGGVTAHAQTFNGQIPGPTFQLKVGDTVIAHYENHLDREMGSSSRTAWTEHRSHRTRFRRAGSSSRSSRSASSRMPKLGFACNRPE